ncbi:MAG: TetR/AcrR family transcriptional regulator [Saprospiraceae bacterium]
MSKEKTTKAKRSKGRPVTFNKKRLINKAIEVYWSNDPSNISVSALCENAGVSKPSLYREFGNEDGLTAAVLEHYMKKVSIEFGAILNTDKKFSVRVNNLINFCSSDQFFNSGCLYFKMRSSRFRFGPRTQKKINQIEEEALALYLSFLKNGQKSGEWKSPIPIKLAALYLYEQIYLTLSQRAFKDDPRSIKAMLKVSLSIFLN